MNFCLAFHRTLVVLVVVGYWAGSMMFAAPDPGSEAIEFFERKVRPILVERCHKCHSAQSEKLKGALRLDSREGMLKGGDTRPAMVPGHPETSLLIEAIGYENPDLQMPPKDKLSDAQIADLAQWIRMGAPWPTTKTTLPVTKNEEFNLAERRGRHWAWQPIQSQVPPHVGASQWHRNPVDQFILAKLSGQGLKPAPPADKRALIRRLYFDLIGLPPAAEEVEAFVRDDSDGALGRLADRLLGSPQFGERWARHWLDLVRYSETLGHEFDYPLPNAWRYRDYVIRAFNADVPYDQFVTEHIAGDLLPKPRRHPTARFNESIIGTSFYWFGQQTHSPVDVLQHQADFIENQIDVLTKTFLGLTVACARCHDHKFDAISTRDYYSLYGVLTSSRYAQRAIDSEASRVEKIARLKSLKVELRQQIAQRWQRQVESLDWKAILDEAGQAKESRAHGTPTFMAVANFQNGNYAGWFLDGEAFGDTPSRIGDFLPGNVRQPVTQLLGQPAAHSGLLSLRLQGALRSPTFTITNRYLHIRLAGRESRVNVFIDNFALIQDPIYGTLRRIVNDDAFKWITIDLKMWPGHRAYVEFSDITTPDLAGGGKSAGYAVDGYIAVSSVVLSDNSAPPGERTMSNTKSLSENVGQASSLPVHGASPPHVSAGKMPSELADMISAPHFQASAREAINAWAADRLSPTPKDEASVALLNWLLKNRLLEGEASDPREPSALGTLLEEYDSVEASLGEPSRVPAMADGNGLDHPVFVRGNPRIPGESVPRRFLEAISGSDQSRFSNGSGRLDLARNMTDRSNPFLARVMVNRVWQHLFGRGLVATPDDFGVLGQPPTHPELLDWLSAYFRDEARWSTKKLIRLLVTSSVYRMSSQPTDRVAEEKDPANLWFHRGPLRRLEGEVIRDSILALSGRLDSTMFGPSVPLHLNEFMEGRGRPGKSGPLDGFGRRSVYVEVRRNFPSPMMRTFDTPVPFTTVGKRTESNVPAQSLILMNDLFVVEQAGQWAKHLLKATHASPDERVRLLYLTALGRPPSKSELTEAMLFLDRQARAYRVVEKEGPVEERVWKDFCHVLFNVKEFVFVN